MSDHWHSLTESASHRRSDVPTYQYACTACGHQLEAVQSFADDALTECPACAGRLRKLYSAVGIVFKGSGFYRTDSRNGANGSGAKKEGADKDGAAKDGAAASSSGGDTANGSAPADTGSGASSSSSSSPSPAATGSTASRSSSPSPAAKGTAA